MMPLWKLEFPRNTQRFRESMERGNLRRIAVNVDVIVAFIH
jgi:hypothetical protein